MLTVKMENELTNARYSMVAMILHWILAFALAFQIGLGWGMDALSIANGLFDVTQLHKSVGITILLLSIARLTWRFLKPPPLPSNSDDIWAQLLSKITHSALYIFMIGAPLSGWLMVSTSNLGIDTYLFTTLYWPHIPGLDLLSVEIRSALNSASKLAHEALAWIGIALFFLHIMGALRHQYFRGEPLLSRMLALPRMEEKRAGSAMIVAIAFILFAMFIWARTWGVTDRIENNVSPIIADNEQRSIAPTALDKLPIDEKIKASEAETTAQEEEDKRAKAKADSSDQAPAIKKAEAADSIPKKWKIIGPKKLSFSVQWNDAVVTGNFSRWSADIYFASNALEQSKITVDVDIASVSTSDSTANGAIMGADFFDSDSFPMARFTSQDIKSLGQNRYQMTGMLRMKNISLPSTIIFTLNEKGRKALAKGSASIDRIKYKLGETGYDEIARNVMLSFEFEAEH